MVVVTKCSSAILKREKAKVVPRLRPVYSIDVWNIVVCIYLID